jgi:hypothetical protein
MSSLIQSWKHLESLGLLDITNHEEFLIVYDSGVWQDQSGS